MYVHRVLLRIPNFLPKMLTEIRSNLLYIHLATLEENGKVKRGRFEVSFGNGAGYIWGRSFFIAAGLKKRTRGLDRVNLQIGFTQDAHSIPYVDGQ